MPIIRRRRIVLDDISEEKSRFVRKVGLWSFIVLLVYSLALGVLLFSLNLAKSASRHHAQPPQLGIARSTEDPPSYRVYPVKEESQAPSAGIVIERILYIPIAGILVGLAGVVYFANRQLTDWIKRTQYDHGPVYVTHPVGILLASLLALLSVGSLIVAAESMKKGGPFVWGALLALLVPGALVYVVRFLPGVLSRLGKRSGTEAG